MCKCRHQGLFRFPRLPPQSECDIVLAQSATVSLSEMFNHGFFMILGLFMFLQFVFRICKINKQEHNNYPPPLILVNYVAKHFSIGLAHWRVVGKNK